MINNILTFYGKTVQLSNITILTLSRNSSSGGNISSEINHRLARWRELQTTKKNFEKKKKLLNKKRRKSVLKKECVKNIASNSLSEKENLLSDGIMKTYLMTNPIGHVSRLEKYTGLLDKKTNDNNNNNIFPNNQNINKYDELIIAYTDASYVPGGPAGIGIFFGINHPLNTSLLLNDVYNSCEAEIIAAQIALRSLAISKYYRNQHIIIRTDFKGIIDAMNNGNEGRFKKEYQLLRSIAKYFPKGVTFEWIKGHNGDYGNEMADYLAKTATNARSRSRPFTKHCSISSFINRSNSATIRGKEIEKNSNKNLSDKIKELINNEEMYKKNIIKKQWN